MQEKDHVGLMLMAEKQSLYGDHRSLDKGT